MHAIPSSDRYGPDLIGRLYASVVEPEPWQDFLNAMQAVTSSNSAAIMLSNEKDSTIDYICATDIACVLKGQLLLYKNEFSYMDPFLNIPEGNPLTVHEYVGENVFVSSEYYRRHLSESSEYFILGVDVRTRNGVRARLRVCRDRHVRDFQGREKTMLAAIAAHLQVAADIFCKFRRLKAEREAFVEGLDRSNLATLILDPSGRVMGANATGTTLLATGREIGVRNGRLAIGHGPANRHLRALLAQGGKSGVFDLLSVPLYDRAGTMNIAVKSVPSCPDDGIEQPSMLALYIGDPSSPTQVSEKSISRLFGLTQAECGIAIALLKGNSLIEAAHQRGIAHNTARRHLRSIFDKVGVSRQAELVRVLMQSTAIAGAD